MGNQVLGLEFRTAGLGLGLDSRRGGLGLFSVLRRRSMKLSID